MLENGLREVINPSSIFTNKENISGVTTTITNEGSRPFAVDIQALVNKTFYNNPRRTTTGVSINRLHQILAVIEKHVGIKLSEYDCYIATGGGFEINEAIRLGIKNILVPKTTIEIKDSFQKLIKIKEISNINEAMNYALKE
jgi:DNA repair protein RadA/Sms